MPRQPRGSGTDRSRYDSPNDSPVGSPRASSRSSHPPRDLWEHAAFFSSTGPSSMGSRVNQLRNDANVGLTGSSPLRPPSSARPSPPRPTVARSVETFIHVNKLDERSARMLRESCQETQAHVIQQGPCLESSNHSSATVQRILMANAARPKCRTPCRFDAQGSCYKGDLCQFLHVVRYGRQPRVTEATPTSSQPHAPEATPASSRPHTSEATPTSSHLPAPTSDDLPSQASPSAAPQTGAIQAVSQNDTTVTIQPHAPAATPTSPRPLAANRDPTSQAAPVTTVSDPTIGAGAVAVAQHQTARPAAAEPLPPTSNLSTTQAQIVTIVRDLDGKETSIIAAADTIVAWNRTAAVGASLSAIAASLGSSRDANHAKKLRCIVQLVTAVLKKTTDRDVMILWAKPACEILTLAFVALGRTEGQHPDDRKRVSTTG